MSTMSSNSSSMYQDLPLNGIDEVRLLRICRDTANGGKADVIECRMDVVNLSLNPVYGAVSYTWGPPTPDDARRGMTAERRHTIKCNGRELLVTENLLNFLKRLRDGTWAYDSLVFCSNGFPEQIWIDSICIDQQDNAERTSQVRMMHRIYREADLVMMWLGDEDAETDMAFRLLNNVAFCSYGDWELIRPRGLDACRDSIGHEDANMACWDAMLRLFQRRYFSRMWIIQEVVSARNASVICGHWMLQWSKVQKVAYHLSLLPSWTRYLATLPLSAQESNTVTESCVALLPPLSVSRQSNYHSETIALREIWQSFETNPATILLQMLTQFRRLQATDPRDKVYALLGITEHIFDPGNVKIKLAKRPPDRYASSPVRLLQPIYDTAKTPQAVYIECAIRLLESRHDLDLLAHVEGPKFQALPNLPSWVPDWSVTLKIGLRRPLSPNPYTPAAARDRKAFSASGMLPRHLTINRATLSLSIQGWRLATITSASVESKESILSNRPFPSWFRILHALPDVYAAAGEWKFDVFMQTLLALPEQETAGLCLRGEEWMFLKLASVAARVHRGGEDCGDEEKGKWKEQTELLDLLAEASQGAFPSAADVMAYLDEGKVWPAGLDRMEMDRVEAFDTLFARTPHMCVFATAEGYLGLGSESCEEGDTVWIVPGSRVPLILRRINWEGSKEDDRNEYTLVGGAYVHGFMYGEALMSDIAGVMGPPVQTLTII